jgi:transposase-like protein
MGRVPPAIPPWKPRFGREPTAREAEGCQRTSLPLTQQAPLGDHASMKPYSEDLRMRIVKAADRGREEGTTKSAIARLFDMSLSSVKRCARSASPVATEDWLTDKEHSEKDRENCGLW